MRETEKSGNQIGSVNRVFRILDIISDNPGISLKELADLLDISKSTTHHYIETLKSNNAVGVESGGYFLDMNLLSFGGNARSQSQIYQQARAEVDELSANTGLVTRIWEKRDDAVILLYQSIEEQSQLEVSIGAREPLYCTAAGKVLLAQLSEKRIHRIIDRLELEKFTDNTITNRQSLYEEIETIQSRGIALEKGERRENYIEVASVVKDTSSNVMGAISIGGPKTQISSMDLTEELAEKIKNSAGTIGITTTYESFTQSANEN